METIKIGRKTHSIIKGDYILFNGACYQFIAGDGRTLDFKYYTSISNLVIPKTLLKKIDLTKLKLVETGKKEDRTYRARYYF